MPPKTGGGSGAREAKAAAQEHKNDQAREKQQQRELEQWTEGAKGKSKADDQKDKAAAAAAKKKELAALLEQEEAALPKAKPRPPPAKASAKPQPPRIPDSLEPTVFGATGIDDALDVLTLVNEPTDKASIGAKAAKTVEQHPERRFKAAFEAYKDAQMPIIRKERPGLRLQQYHNALYTDFQKSPLNPFNQVSVAYDATKQEKVEMLKTARNATAERLRLD